MGIGALLFLRLLPHMHTYCINEVSWLAHTQFDPGRGSPPSSTNAS